MADAGPVIETPPAMTINDFMQQLYSMRLRGVSRYLETKKDIDAACGYLTSITIDHYKQMYLREGIGTRVVHLYPDECWPRDPETYESEDDKITTDWEKAWKELSEELNVNHYLHRVDQESGVGHFGLLLIGFDDGLDLNEPVPGVPEDGVYKEENVKKVGGRKVNFFRVFDESLVTIKEWEMEVKNPRYGLPKLYSIKFFDPTSEDGMAQGTTGDVTEKLVHWSRVLHVADNRKSSEVFGTPRMQPVWNYLTNIRKVLGGSGEMFWQGGFPGFALEAYPELGDVEIDKAKLEKEMEKYSAGLQRFLALEGMGVKPLTPQVADPTHHIAVQLQAAAITLHCPLRILMGTEEAKLASGQDIASWHRRCARRQSKYLTPMLIHPFIRRLILAGVLPRPQQLITYWPDLGSPSDTDKADILVKRTQALATYQTGQVETLVPPLEYFTKFCGFSLAEARILVAAAEKRVADLDDELVRLMPHKEAAAPGPNPQGAKPGLAPRRAAG